MTVEGDGASVDGDGADIVSIQGSAAKLEVLLSSADDVEGSLKLERVVWRDVERDVWRASEGTFGGLVKGR